MNHPHTHIASLSKHVVADQRPLIVRTRRRSTSSNEDCQLGLFIARSDCKVHVDRTPPQIFELRHRNAGSKPSLLPRLRAHQGQSSTAPRTVPCCACRNLIFAPELILPKPLLQAHARASNTMITTRRRNQMCLSIPT